MAQVITGTVAVTNGSAAIVGTGTTWSTDGIVAGHGFTVVASGVSYDVASVTDDTNIVLSANYAGATDSGLSYAIYKDFTSPDSIPELNAGDIETPTIWTRGVRKIQSLLTGIISGGTTLTNVDIDSGAIDNAVIGASTPSTGTFSDVILGSPGNIGSIRVSQSSDSPSDGIGVENAGSAASLRLWVDGSNFIRIDGNGSGNGEVAINRTGSGKLTVNGNDITSHVAVPSTTTSTGTTGQVSFDATHAYFCHATDSWRRVATSTW